MTLTSRTFVRAITGTSLAVFLSASLPMNAYAGMIGTQAVLDATTDQDRAEQLSKVEAMLARDDVQKRLVSLGVNPSDALQRARALSNADLAKLASKSDDLRAGGDGGVFALIGVVFVVLLILDYLDVVHVFHHRH